MFTKFKKTNKFIVATIGGKLNRLAGISTVKWKWKDDNGVMHKELLEQVLYFPQSTITIMSVTEFARQLDDEEGTSIDMKMKYSRFYCKNNKYSQEIYHSASNLPELAVNEENSLFTWFTEKFKTHVDDNVVSTCCFTNTISRSTAA